MSDDRNTNILEQALSDCLYLPERQAYQKENGKLYTIDRATGVAELEKILIKHTRDWEREIKRALRIIGEPWDAGGLHDLSCAIYDNPFGYEGTPLMKLVESDDSEYSFSPF